MEIQQPVMKWVGTRLSNTIRTSGQRFYVMTLRYSSRRGQSKHALHQTPGITIFLPPVAPPAALGLAGFVGSTWITSSYIADWWGAPESPTLFFPFVGIGGLAQFIAGLHGSKARDTLVTVINTMWGSSWISIGISYAFVLRCRSSPAALRAHPLPRASELVRDNSASSRGLAR
ncbi:hypothetical protein F4809DRAFT_642594 [Biscogniauxia mediterranea]|nr:hypothetical protein F4809DRAFT_642594 [Biscogniauxia mediterranea]